MKIQSTNKLAFAKSSLVELNDNQLHDVNGGATPVASLVLTIIVVATIMAD